jgi:hypothetical protein
MASRRPLVNVSGSIRELPTGDTLPGVRELLTAARTYYVRTDGSDSNTGLSNTSGGAFLTIQKAIDVATTADLNGFTVTLKLGDGTYTQPLSLKPFVGAGEIVIEGNSASPGNVVLSTSATCINATNCGNYTIQYLRLQATAGYGVFASGARTALTLKGLVYGTMSAGGIHVYITARASVTQNTTPYSIVGGAYAHIYASEGGSIEASSATVTLTGTPAFSVFAFAENTALVRLVANSYSGSATGSRYSVSGNAIMFTAGAGASYLPGSTAGTEATGGRYL